MGIRGRKSAESLSVAVVNVSHRRVAPPDELPEPVKLIWRELVDALPGDRFHRSDRPLLALYCRALHQASLAFAKLEKHGAFAAGELNPWLRVVDVASKQAAVLATKLRLCPQSRLDRKTAGPMARTDNDGARPWTPE